MIVKELIKFLEAQPQGAKVVFPAIDSDAGYDEMDKAELIPVVQVSGYDGEYFDPDEVKDEAKRKIQMVVRLW